MQTAKSYIVPVTNRFQLSPKDRLMDVVAPTGSHVGAPVRFPEDN